MRATLPSIIIAGAVAATQDLPMITSWESSFSVCGMEQALTAHYNTSNYSSNWSHCKEFIPLWADAPHLDLQQQEPGLKIAATQCSQQPPGGPTFKWFHTLVFRALSSYRLKKEVLVAKYCLTLSCVSVL